MSLNQPVGVPYQNPLDYTGPQMNLIPIMRFPRRPLTTDKKFRVGQTAILGKNPSTGSEGELWFLSKFESNGDATWVQFDHSGNTGILSLQTDDGAPAVEPNGSGVVGILGGTGIVTSGQDPDTDVTISLDGSIVGQTITGDSGGALSPTAGNWNILGGTGLDTSGAGSSLTINLDGGVVTSQYDADTGSATPTAGVLNILGGNGIATSASGNSVTTDMSSPFTGDFQFTRDSSDTTLEVETTTSGDAILSLSPSGATAYTIEADRTSGTFQLKQSSNVLLQATSDGNITKPLNAFATAAISSAANNATGMGTVFPIICDTEVVDRGSDYNNVTGVFTCPVAGLYTIHIICTMGNLTAAMTAGQLGIGINGTSFSGQDTLPNPGATRDASNENSFNFSTYLQFSASDTVQPLIQISNGAGDTASVERASFFIGLIE